MNLNFQESVIPAAVGWELVTVTFERGPDSPEVTRDPVIAWHVTKDHTLPVFPWARMTEPVDMEIEYNAYLCPDGSIVGGIHMPRFDGLQDFLDACVEAEQLSADLGDDDWLGGSG